MHSNTPSHQALLGMSGNIRASTLVGYGMALDTTSEVYKSFLALDPPSEVDQSNEKEKFNCCSCVDHWKWTTGDKRNNSVG